MSEKVNWNFVVEEDYPNPSECKTIIAWSDMSKNPIILTAGNSDDRYGYTWLDSNGLRFDNFSYWSYIFPPD